MLSPAIVRLQVKQLNVINVACPENRYGVVLCLRQWIIGSRKVNEGHRQTRCVALADDVNPTSACLRTHCLSAAAKTRDKLQLHL